MNIIIGNAWPYANGSLHIGHIAALLPGDILARYFRAKGDNVFFVSGSDCHGTPVTIRAKQEKSTPREISDKYHEEFSECFQKLGFSYDLYSKTSSEEHKSFVRDFHKKLYEGGYVYEKTIQQSYCSHCGQFLPDRFVRGVCPNCGSAARGDQCEACGNVLEPENLIDPVCSICGETPELRPSSHLFLAVTKLKEALEAYVESHQDWRKNAYEMSKRYIREGLRDRALTRDLDWGIDAPKEGYENKKIYIWAENVLGYVSDCYRLCLDKGRDFLEVWNNSRQYYIHGKDNIPFHTIILPSLLLGRTDVKFKLPDDIISSEYLTLEGRKISTSGNWAIWAKDLLQRYDPDSIRYFLTANGPEQRDTDFTWNEFINSHNGELLGAYGNLVNRSLVFIEKFFEGRVPGITMAITGTASSEAGNAYNAGTDESESVSSPGPSVSAGHDSAALAILTALDSLYPTVGSLIEQGSFRAALDSVFAFVRRANKYFDEEQPWITVRNDPEKCGTTLNTCVQIIANLAVLLDPFLPFSSAKIRKILGPENPAWSPVRIPAGHRLGPVEILFERIDKKVIQEEQQRLKESCGA
ncbi:MAG TPA: methionine--tRNA ligase [Clostridia bacterium]|nr:methionine--tRNA ligase [Clostridia bacterium]